MLVEMQLWSLTVLLVALIALSRADYDCTIVPGNGTVDIDACSKFPDLIDEVIMTKCNTDFPASDDLPIGLCTAQCLLNATNVIVKETGKVNVQPFKDMIKAKSVGAWANVASAALDTCFKLVAAQETTVNSMLPNPGITTILCHAQSAVLITCLYTQLFINTPDTEFNQNSNNVCPALKDFVKNCAVE